MSRRILIVANPVAGLRPKRDLAEVCARRVEASGHEVELRSTNGHGDAAEVARGARDAFDVVAALGGDGTVGQVADGLVGGRAALGILPAGTRNVVAREAGIPRNPRIAAERLGTYPLQRLSLGHAGGRHFALCVSAGIDAAVLRAAQDISPGRLTLPVMARAVGRTMLGGRWPRLVVRGPTGDVGGTMVIIANARGYGGIFKAAPDASLADGLLHVCVIQGTTRGALMRTLVEMVPGWHVRRGDVRYFPAERVRVEAPEEPVDWERDGDVEGRLPLEVTAVPDALRLASPLGTPAAEGRPLRLAVEGTSPPGTGNSPI